MPRAHKAAMDGPPLSAAFGMNLKITLLRNIRCATTKAFEMVAFWL